MSGMTFDEFNQFEAAEAEILADQTGILVVKMLAPSLICSCDGNGPCCAHAPAYNALKEAEQALLRAAKAFIEARP
jgi:hypothetical protein